MRYFSFKKAGCIIYVSAFVFLQSCINGYTAWEKDTIKNGIKFSKLRYALKDQDTIAVIGYLSEPAVIEDFPCAADWVHFTKDWKLSLFRLDQPAVINNFDYGKDCWIRFKETGHTVICSFPEDTEVQGLMCRGGGGVSGIQTTFYKSGRLESFYPTDVILIGDVLCKGSIFHNIVLHEDGTLKTCTLARDQKINDKMYEKGTRIVIDKNGSASIVE